jgi:hypothetical protein
MIVTIDYFKFESVIGINIINTYFEEIPVPGFVLGFDPHSYSPKIFDFLKTTGMEDRNQDFEDSFHAIYQEIEKLIDCKIRYKTNFIDCERVMNAYIEVVSFYGS